MLTLETFHWYYRIEGQPSLYTIASENGTDDTLRVLLCDPVLWIYSEYGLTRIIHDEIQIQLKLLFIANLILQYLSSEDDLSAVGRVVKDLLGEPPISVETFDRWWKIELYQDEELSGDVENSISSRELKMLSKTGYKATDLWLEELLKQKEALENPPK